MQGFHPGSYIPRPPPDGSRPDLERPREVSVCHEPVDRRAAHAGDLLHLSAPQQSVFHHHYLILKFGSYQCSLGLPVYSCVAFTRGSGARGLAVPVRVWRLFSPSPPSCSAACSAVSRPMWARTATLARTRSPARRASRCSGEYSSAWVSPPESPSGLLRLLFLLFSLPSSIGLVHTGGSSGLRPSLTCPGMSHRRAWVRRGAGGLADWPLRAAVVPANGGECRVKPLAHNFMVSERSRRKWGIKWPTQRYVVSIFAG